MLLGIFLLIASVTGSLLVFHHEIDALQYGDLAELDKPFKDQEDVYLGGERIAPPKLTAYLRYRLLDNRLGLNLQYTGIGKRDRFEQNEKGSYNVYQGPVEAYQLVNVSASYKMSNSTTLNLGVENLLNEDYFPTRGQWFVLPSYYSKGKGASFNLSMIVEL